MASEFWILAVPILLFNFFVALIVDGHAKKRGHKGYFWLVFFLGVIGVLLYVADSPPSATSAESSTTKREKSKSLEEQGAEHSVKSVYKSLKEVGEAPPDYFKENVFPVYPAGYTSEDDWWIECISPKLQKYPDIISPKNDDDNWGYRPKSTKESNRKDSKQNADERWVTVPGSPFMHRELGERGRGMLIEVTDEEKAGNFYIKDEMVSPESYVISSRNGDEWVSQVKSYLEEQYHTL